MLNAGNEERLVKGESAVTLFEELLTSHQSAVKEENSSCVSGEALPGCSHACLLNIEVGQALLLPVRDRDKDSCVESQSNLLDEPPLAGITTLHLQS